MLAQMPIAQKFSSILCHIIIWNTASKNPIFTQNHSQTYQKKPKYGKQLTDSIKPTNSPKTKKIKQPENPFCWQQKYSKPATSIHSWDWTESISDWL